MLCDTCLIDVIIPKLRDEDIAVLEYLNNNGVTFPQVAKDKQTICNVLNFPICKGGIALTRLECYNMINIKIVSKLYTYYITEDGIKALQILSIKMGGE
jgi:hypothetical protein